MQVVGQVCGITGRKIMTSAEGIGCLQCEAAYLRSSLEGLICPKCGQDMTVVETQLKEKDEKESSDLRRKGKANFQILEALLIAFYAVEELGFILKYLKAGSLGIFSHIPIFLVFALWTGRTWARMACFFYLLVRAPNLWTMVSDALRKGDGTSIFFASSLVVLAVAAVVLLCLPATNHYLDSRQKSQG